MFFLITWIYTMHSLFPATILICFGPAIQAGDQENPFRKGAVGDWVEYTMTGPSMEGETKMRKGKVDIHGISIIC